MCAGTPLALLILVLQDKGGVLARHVRKLLLATPLLEVTLMSMLDTWEGLLHSSCKVSNLTCQC
jgi:hypothetical protein